jgi:hypothetical protein
MPSEGPGQSRTVPKTGKQENRKQGSNSRKKGKKKKRGRKTVPAAPSLWLPDGSENEKYGGIRKCLIS